MSTPDLTFEIPDPDDTMAYPVAEELKPLPAMPEPRPFPLFPIGDALIAEMPGFDILPCGRCGAAFSDAPPAILRRARILSYLVVLAGEAGWASHPDWGWCCPACTAVLGQPAEHWEDGSAAALRAHLDLLADYDRKAARIMASFEGGTWEPSRYCRNEGAASVTEGSWAA